jgi:thimet oligopeptidase
MINQKASPGSYDLRPLRFQYRPDEIDNLSSTQQSQLLAALEPIARLPADRCTFANTVLAMEQAMTRFSNALNPVVFLKYVSSDAEVRNSADRCETEMSQLLVDIFVRADLYAAIKSGQAHSQNLDPVEKRLLEEYTVNFRRNGLELPAADRAKFVEKRKRLVLVEAEFAKNLVEWDDALIVETSQLRGLPENYIRGLKKIDDNHRRITLSYPDYFTFMENAEDGEARRQLEIKFFNRGGEKNLELMAEALELRNQTAQMLGYRNHAEFVLERRMAKRPEAVLTFLDRLKDRLQQLGRQELEVLLEAKRQHLGNPGIKDLHSYDLRFYETLIKRTRHRIDMQKIKEYFPLDVVINGMFEIYQTLFGVSFEQDSTLPSWHPSVVGYRIRREKMPIAVFYMDLFPRDGKYGHAAAFTLASGHLPANSERYEAPVSAIVANFNPPSEGLPSLLEHGEVETLFHEFGHIMHQVLTTARFATFSGTSVLRDFVEAPSQMLESWVWEKLPLAKLSGHYLDRKKPLPDDQVHRLLEAKLFNTGLKYLRQLFFAQFDMTLHTGSHASTTEIYRNMMRDIALIAVPEGTMPEASFGHLMGGYDAGYYGYLWSEVFATDMFTRFEKEGLLNRQTGEDYLNWILRPGGEAEPAELIRGFLGREPNEQAFLKSIGL